MPVIGASTSHFFVYLNWYKPAFLLTETLLCCKESGFWVILLCLDGSYLNIPPVYLIIKQKHNWECLKQSKFFRWENIKAGDRKQFVPFSDSWTCVCQRMEAGHRFRTFFSLLIYLDNATTFFLFDRGDVTKLGQRNFNVSQRLTPKPRAELSPMYHALCSLLFHCLQMDDGTFRSQVEKKLGPWLTAWKKVIPSLRNTCARLFT